MISQKILIKMDTNRNGSIKFWWGGWNFGLVWMLTKYKNVRPKNGVNKPFEKYFHICGVFRNLFKEGAPKFDIYSSVFFSGRIILKRHFILFWTIFRQIWFKFCAPNSECCTKCDAFCSYIFDYACLGRKAYLLSKRFEIIEKLYLSKTRSKMAGGGMHPPIPPESAPGH